MPPSPAVSSSIAAVTLPPGPPGNFRGHRGLTEKQPARDLSRPPPRPVGASIGPCRPPPWLLRSTRPNGAAPACPARALALFGVGRPGVVNLGHGVRGRHSLAQPRVWGAVGAVPRLRICAMQKRNCPSSGTVHRTRLAIGDKTVHRDARRADEHGFKLEIGLSFLLQSALPSASRAPGVRLAERSVANATLRASRRR